MNVTLQRLIFILLLKSEASKECPSLLRSLHSRGAKPAKSEGRRALFFFFFFTVCSLYRLIICDNGFPYEYWITARFTSPFAEYTLHLVSYPDPDSHPIWESGSGYETTLQSRTQTQHFAAAAGFQYLNLRQQVQYRID